MIIPNLPTRNENIPKTGARKATFRPPANTAGDTSPTDSIASKAPINPMICPRKPQTIANKAIELIKLMVLSTDPLCKNPFTIRMIIKIRIIKSGYIKNAPPSFKRSNNIVKDLRLIGSKIEKYTLSHFFLRRMNGFVMDLT